MSANERYERERQLQAQHDLRRDEKQCRCAAAFAASVPLIVELWAAASSARANSSPASVPIIGLSRRGQDRRTED